MAAPSLTSSDSFLLRAQRSELRRVVIMGVGLFALTVLVCVRRALGSEVLGAGRVFWPVLLVLLLGAAYQAVAYWYVRRAVVAGTVLPEWRWWVSAAADLAVPVGILAILAWESPRGPIAALTEPALLLLPMVVMLSVLRLRPWFTFWAGVAAGVSHWALTTRAIVVTHVHQELFPGLFGHGVLLVLTGVAGAMVAREAKRYVMDTVDEAMEAERARARVAGMERDLSVAREIQRGLLPSGKPDFPGFDIAGMNRSADQTGGDYYDWQRLPNGRMVVVMADVTGHGIGPALVMAVCRAYARATAPIVTDPCALLERLNELISGDLQAGRFITLAIAALDRSGSVVLLSAGHGPTLLYRAATGGVEEFGGDGLPLGIDASEKYGPTRTFTMERSDVLVLLTDGYFESQSGSGEAFGIKRLAAALADAARSVGDAAAMLAQIDETVRAFVGGAPQKDDMTAVVIRRV